MPTRPITFVCSAAVTTLLASACLERELKPITPCLVSGVSTQVRVQNIDKVDLLFMVDNSHSMDGEQRSLRDQLPKVVNVLTSGTRPGSAKRSTPVRDLHVGVVSSDMGVPGVNFGKCRADGGDDGKLQNTPRGPGCDASYPSFLSYNGNERAGTLTDANKFANDVGCIATLGTEGCGFEQQLEAPLKALWPSVYMDRAGNVVMPNPYRFLATKPENALGRGDIDPMLGGNRGFLRNDPVKGLSLIAIVVVTDEEDCSVRSADHLWPTELLPADSPYKSEVDINLRCFNHPDLSYSLDRYYNGFRALRPGNEELVVFAAIVGVPEDTVNKQALAGVDFKDDKSRDAFYDRILADPRMQQVVDPATMPGMGKGNLRPSCAYPVPTPEGISTAYPPVRIVQLAKRFGENGIVQSICQEDFGPAMDAILNVITGKIDEVCFPRPLVRQRDGTVSCNVVWELPKDPLPGSNAPTDCDQESFLAPADPGRKAVNSQGGKNCKVVQLPVTNLTPTWTPAGDGWYYDDYSEERSDICDLSKPQRVAFTPAAKPPSGVTVKLECLNETQTYANTRVDLHPAFKQPEIGSACGEDVINATTHGDAACVLTKLDGTPDPGMFCHPNLNVCVQGCTSDRDCPPAWVCDSRAETLAIQGLRSAYCVNPTCAVDNTSRVN